VGAFSLIRTGLVTSFAHASSGHALQLPQGILDDLARVETRLAEELGSREPRLSEIAGHLVGAGGKRIRPTVVLLVAHAAAGAPPARREDVIEAAVALELIHSATLLHDDIIDGGELRRASPRPSRSTASARPSSRATSSSAARSRSAPASRPR
jgi:geranylgeranyl pyrophosphate synthase